LKTIEESTTVLALRRIPVFLWLFGLIFVAFGVGSALLIGKQATLNCQRRGSSGDCQFVTRSLIGPSSVMTFAAEDLQGAELQWSEDSDGEMTYRVAFRVRGEWIPLIGVFSSGSSGKQSAVQSINAFVSDHTQTALAVRQDDRMFAMIFGGIFSLAGLAIIVFFGQIVTLRFDRATGTVTLRRVGLSGVREGEYPLSDFNDAVVDYSNNTCRVSLVTKNGDHLPLTSEYSSGARGKEATARKIREFLRPGGVAQDHRPEWLK
jgi:hypothetical protein